MYEPTEIIRQTDNVIETPWFADFNNLMLVVVINSLACGVAAALVARHNDRSIVLGFLSGFFFGQFGVMTHMIMGERIGHKR